MCGIIGIFQIKQQTDTLRQKALRMSYKLRHRGPDWSGIYTAERIFDEPMELCMK